jgi:hypothetical protein
MADMENALFFSLGVRAATGSLWPRYTDPLTNQYPNTTVPMVFLQGTLDGQTEYEYVSVSPRDVTMMLKSGGIAVNATLVARPGSRRGRTLTTLASQRSRS